MQEANINFSFMSLQFKICVNTKIFNQSIHIPKIALAKLLLALPVHGPCDDRLALPVVREAPYYHSLILDVNTRKLNVLPTFIPGAAQTTE